MQVMFQLMMVSPKISSCLSSPPLAITPQNAEVSFQNVSFEYLPGQRILSDLSFTVPAGHTYAIVGGSGSGKSTIIRLLYRFMEPGSGNITVGGQNVANVNVDSLRKEIAVVPQDCVLFHDTILHNIKYGDLGADNDRVEEAAKMAELHHTILDWPHGYNTQVGERGLKLSGGEKQRVAIARAILKNSPILIFDEATSSLDSITERGIMTALQAATSGRTSIIIAHRLSTVVHCDTILVLNKGTVAESGTHAELLAREGSIYKNLWDSQNSIDGVKVDNSAKESSKSSWLKHEHDDGCGGCGHAH